MSHGYSRLIKVSLLVILCSPASKLLLRLEQPWDASVAVIHQMWRLSQGPLTPHAQKYWRSCSVIHFDPDLFFFSSVSGRLLRGGGQLWTVSLQKNPKENTWEGRSSGLQPGRCCARSDLPVEPRQAWDGKKKKPTPLPHPPSNDPSFYSKHQSTLFHKDQSLGMLRSSELFQKWFHFLLASFPSVDWLFRMLWIFNRAPIDTSTPYAWCFFFMHLGKEENGTAVDLRLQVQHHSFLWISYFF